VQRRGVRGGGLSQGRSCKKLLQNPGNGKPKLLMKALVHRRPFANEDDEDDDEM
jgi:hypothetical protein